MFSEVAFCNSAEYGILYGIDFISRNSAEFFTAQNREIPYRFVYTEFRMPSNEKFNQIKWSKLMNNGNEKTSLKGRVSQDFSSPFILIKQLLLVPIAMARNDFEFFLIFVELFVFLIDSKLMNVPGS